MIFRIEGYIGEEPNTAAAIADHLDKLKGGPAEIVINSGGGNAFEGAAISAEMRSSRSKINVRINGLAASAASLIAVAGDLITMDPAAHFMIHDPSGVAMGTAETMRETAAILEKLADTYAREYAASSGNSAAHIRNWMLAETWLTAEEALALNFIDQIEERREKVTAAAHDYTQFKNAPTELVALAKVMGWATHSPDIEQKEPV
ncbi:Clp protease ClpP [Rhodobacteraceae bacterium NNCM2]|nr:Clp protease ClpP [Coraliihabitans acroporae]